MERENERIRMREKKKIFKKNMSIGPQEKTRKIKAQALILYINIWSYIVLKTSYLKWSVVANMFTLWGNGMRWLEENLPSSFFSEKWLCWVCPTSPRADLDKHVDHPVSVSRWIEDPLFGADGRKGRRKGWESRERQHQGQVWSSCYRRVGGLLDEASLNPDFTEVKNLGKDVFGT